MTKFKKFLASLLSCCLALVLVFAAGCTQPDDSSSSSGGSSTTTSSSEDASSSTAAASSSDSESSSAASSSSSEAESSDSTQSSSSESESVDSSSSDSSVSESTDSSSTDSSVSESTDSSSTDSSVSESTDSSSTDSSDSESSDSSGGTSDDEGNDDYTLTSTTVYFVGDSTVCSFNDTTYYYPRYGYGTQFSNYIDSSYVTVNNLALSGRSSKSFISESNYTTLTSNITTGDYLIIGFGHNDEKYDDSTRYTSPDLDAAETEGTFQYYLYTYYIKVALDAGATPILCTPIVRANSSDNYTGSSGHVVSGYGDYAACIRDLAEDYNITCIDLTALTTELYTSIGYSEAINYHAWTTSNSASADTTHLNIYGAKNVAYMIASELQSVRKTCNLGYYVNSDIAAPTKANDLVVNSAYVESSYEAFDPTTDVSENFTLSTSGWYGTAFGDTGTGNFVSGGYVVSDDSTTGTITVGQSLSSGSKGKIGSTEGIAMAFMQLAYNQNFTMTVTATVTTASNSTTSGTAAAKQSGFGIMLRDDIYIDSQDKSILSNYITAGMYMSGDTTTQIIYSRENTTLTNSGNNVSSAYSAGDTATLTLVRNGQNITCTVVYGGKTYSYTYYDFDLNASDGAYNYLGFYATRGTIVEFSSITYTETGTDTGA